MKSSSKKIAVVVISLAFVALAGWIFYSPYLAVQSFSTQSAETRDAAADAQATVDAAAADTANNESNAEMALVSVPALNLGEFNCDMEYGKSIAAAGLKSKKVSVHGPDDEDFPGYGCAYRISPAPGTKVQKRSKVTYRSAWEAG
jgi:nitrogen fixation protein FixH